MLLQPTQVTVSELAPMPVCILQFLERRELVQRKSWNPLEETTLKEDSKFLHLTVMLMNIFCDFSY